MKCCHWAWGKEQRREDMLLAFRALGCKIGAPTAVYDTSQLRHFIVEVLCSGYEEMGAALIGADQNILSSC